MLKINPNHGMAQYQLAIAYQRKRDLTRSQQEYRRFLGIWKLADPNIPEVRAAQAALRVN